MIKKLFCLMVIGVSAVLPSAAQSAGAAPQELEDGFIIPDSPTPAPDFTLKDLAGKDVSLSDFRGKWVIIDFWGTWCRFCIQGIPEMKEAYSKLHPQGLEIIGVDCGDTDEAWRAAVERFQLPWVNVYNPAPKRSEGICNEYGVIGFPTKVIVNPDGTINRTFIGEDPAFYEFLYTLFE